MAGKITHPSKLSPDGSGRFFMMARLLNILYGTPKKPLKILDAGGSSLYMSEILKDTHLNYDITTIDILPKPKGFKGEYIQGDATKTDFSDKQFDTVVSTDVLEHVPPHLKDAFVKECIRVAKDFVIIAAPFDTIGVDEAEHATNDFNKFLFKEGQAWLEEHFEYKKPSLERVVDIAREVGYKPYVIGTNNLYVWLASTHTNLIEAKLGLNKRKHVDANNLLSQSILESGDMTPPFYRHFVVIPKNPLSGKRHKEIEKLTAVTAEHASSIRYIHELMALIADSMTKSALELKHTRQEQATKDINNRLIIDRLKRENAEKDELIQRARHYLKLRSITSKKVAKRIKKIGRRR